MSPLCPKCGAGLVIFADCKPRNQCVTGLQCVDKCGFEVPMTEVLSRLAAAKARIVELEAACEAAMNYYEMLERQTGVTHGVLQALRAALAKKENHDE